MERHIAAAVRSERVPVTGHLASLGEEISGGGIAIRITSRFTRSDSAKADGREISDAGSEGRGGRRKPRAVRTLMAYGRRVCSASRISLRGFGWFGQARARVVFLARKRAAGAGGDSSRKSGDAGGARTASVASTRRRRVRGSEDTRRCRASRRGRVLCGRVGRGRQRGFARRGNARLAFVRTWRRTPCACSGCVARRVRPAP